MSKFRFVLSSVSAFVVLAGGAVLSTPASATATYFACSDRQVDYVIDEIYDVCGSGGGSATVVCDGANIQFRSITCN
jgi:hypothetical protein